MLYTLKLVPLTVLFVVKCHKIKPAGQASDENSEVYQSDVFSQKIEVVGRLRMLNKAEV